MLEGWRLPHADEFLSHYQSFPSGIPSEGFVA